MAKHTPLSREAVAISPGSAVERAKSNRLTKVLDDYFVWFCIIPAIVVIFAFVLYPAGHVIWNSFYLDHSGRFRYVAWKQYWYILFKDRNFWTYFIHTLEYSGFSSLISFAMGLTLALCLQTCTRFQTFFRTWTLIPWAIPPVVSGFIFKWYFHDVYGAANDLLLGLGILSKSVAWLADATLAMIVLIFADAWTRVPFVAVILLAGLQTVPEELYDAAKVDGASTVQLFRNVTLPYLKSAIMVAMMAVTMFSFRVIAIMLTLTDGQPGDATELFASYIYKKAFIDFRFGRSAAASVIMMLMIIVIALTYTLSMRSEVKE
jgi:multiple sugar transport system permease protein